MASHPWIALALAAMFSLAACGEEPEYASLEFSLPFQSGLSANCTNPAGLVSPGAVLRIGGHQDCELSVDDTTFEISGSCERITIGIVRPLMLVYTVTSASAGVVPVAYNIGWVDLNRDRIKANTEEIVVNLSGDDEQSSIIHTEEEAQGLNEATALNINLESAKKWAATKIEENSDSLDHDQDTCPNLVEACELTLEDALHQQACP